MKKKQRKEKGRSPNGTQEISRGGMGVGEKGKKREHFDLKCVLMCTDQ